MSSASAAVNSTPTEPVWLDGMTIGQVLRETASRFPDNDACVFSQSGTRMTWKEFDAEVDRVARALLGLGLEPGDHFGLWATNIPQWVLIQYATARIGVVQVNVNPAYRLSEVKYAMQQSEIRGLALIDCFKSTDYCDILTRACPELQHCDFQSFRNDEFPKLQWVVSLRGQKAPGMIGWDEFLELAENVSPERLAEVESQLSDSDPINIQYTSGTTGFPKGATLSHRNLLLNAYYGGDFQQLTQQDRICITVPLYHCFGCVLGSLTAVVTGAAMIYPSEGFSAEETLKSIEAERCTSIYGVPTMFIAEFEHPDFPQRDLSSLRTGIMAGAPCPVELMKKVVSDMGAAEMLIGYGQTEASPIITMTRTDDPLELRVGTIGPAIPGVEAKIIDQVTGEELPDRQQGELCCRGHNVMLGYYKMPDKTAAAVDAEGWLHTGDLALREPNGYYRITGRLKDLIIRGGENVYPREIEERLYEHAAVEDVQIVGVPDKKFGEEVLAWIKVRQGVTVTEDEIRTFCKATLAHYKTPRYVKFVDSFPTTVTGKIQKFKIREIAIQELGLQEAAQIETA